MSTKILKNQTFPSVDVTIKTAGYTVLAGSSYTIEVSEFRLWATPDAIAELTPYIVSGDIVVNDGINDLAPFYAIEHMKYPDFAFSQRFLSEPERSEVMFSKTTQEAIEEARLNVEKNGVSVMVDSNTMNFLDDNIIVTKDDAIRRTNIQVVGGATDMVFHRRNSVGEFNLATSHCSGKMIDIGPLPVVDRCGVAVVAIHNRAQPYDICFPPKPKCRGETCKVGP